MHYGATSLSWGTEKRLLLFRYLKLFCRPSLLSGIPESANHFNSLFIDLHSLLDLIADLLMFAANRAFKLSSSTKTLTPIILN